MWYLLVFFILSGYKQVAAYDFSYQSHDLWKYPLWQPLGTDTSWDNFYGDVYELEAERLEESLETQVSPYYIWKEKHVLA